MSHTLSSSKAGEASIENNKLSQNYTVVAPPDTANWTLLTTDPDEGIGSSLKAAYSQMQSNIVFFKVDFHHPWANALQDIDTGIMIDADRNISTGMPANYYSGEADCIGSDYMILVGNEGTEMWRWNQTQRSYDTSRPIGLLYLDAPESSSSFVVGVALSDLQSDGAFDCSFNDITTLGSYAVWDWMPNSGYVPFVAQKAQHDLVVTLETPRMWQPQETYTLTAKVFNFGQTVETGVNLKLYINGVEVNSASFASIGSEGFNQLTYAWTPTEGYYNITAYAASVAGESTTANNQRSRLVPVTEKIAVISDNAELWGTLNVLDSMNINYDYYGSNGAQLYTANLNLLKNYPTVIYYNYARNISTAEKNALDSYLTNGGNLLVTGYDSLYFTDSKLAQVVRATSFGDDNSQTDLYVRNASHPIMNGPYGQFNAGYHVSDLFRDNDAIEANTGQNARTIAELADGKDKIIAAESLPGTVVFWNGDGASDWYYNADCNAMLKNLLIWFVDATPPVTTDDYDGEWQTSDFTINLEASDYFGVNQTYYKINGGLTKSVSEDGQPQITVENANNTLEYWSTDITGNEETHHFLTQIKLDKTVPTGTLQINNGATYTNTPSVSLALSVSDTDGLMRFSNDNTIWGNWQVYSSTAALTLQGTDGTKLIFVQFKDNAGLISASASAQIILDTTAPTAVAGQSRTVTSGDSVTFDGSGSSDANGITSYRWDFDDGSSIATGATVTHTYTTTGPYYVILNVEDSAGNKASTTITITVQANPTPTPTPIQTVSPTVSPTTKPTPTASPTATPTPTPTPSSSNTIPVTVPNGMTEQFTIDGNITSTQISNAKIQVDQTAKTTTLSFTITGQAGTTGYGNITIPKSQVPIGTAPVISIDAKQVEDQGYTQDADNYYVWYTTHFSTHEVSVVFSGTVEPPNDNILLYVGAIGIVLVCVAVAFVVLRQRKKA